MEKLFSIVAQSNGNGSGRGDVISIAASVYLDGEEKTFFSEQSSLRTILHYETLLRNFAMFYVSNIKHSVVLVYQNRILINKILNDMHQQENVHISPQILNIANEIDIEDQAGKFIGKTPLEIAHLMIEIYLEKHL